MPNGLETASVDCMPVLKPLKTSIKPVRGVAQLMSTQEINPHQSLLYRNLACCYDPLFKKSLAGRIQQAIHSLNIRRGSRVLDVGIGTGHYLAAYPRHASVVGVDLSSAMLQIAAREIEKQDWRHVTLQQMNALELRFDADSFDYVMGFHTASVVDNPRRLMEEMVRVCKPGGTIVIINYFPTQKSWLSPMVDAASSLTKWLGWHMHVKYDDLFDHPEIRVRQRYKTSSLSFFTVVVCQKQDSGESGALRTLNLTKAKNVSAHNLHYADADSDHQQLNCGRSLR